MPAGPRACPASGGAQPGRVSRPAQADRTRLMIGLFGHQAAALRHWPECVTDDGPSHGHGYAATRARDRTPGAGRAAAHWHRDGLKS